MVITALNGERVTIGALYISISRFPVQKFLQFYRIAKSIHKIFTIDTLPTALQLFIPACSRFDPPRSCVFCADRHGSQ